MARANLAVAAIVIVTVLVPVAVAVRVAARERALGNAEREAAGVVAALAISDDPASFARAVTALDTHWRDRVGVHGLGRTPLGVRHASAADVQRAAEQRRSSLVAVAGGLAYLQPVDLSQGRVAVAEIFVPDEEISQGVAGTWWLLGCMAVALVVIGVVAADRVATRTARSARALTSAAMALGEGDLGVRVPVRGPRELAEAAATFNVMADRVATQLTLERELIADRSHRLRTPLTALRLEAERLRASGRALRLTQAVEAMEREVDHVIHTARRSADHSALHQEEQCDAAEVVRERMSFWAAVAEDQSRPFAVYGANLRAPVPLPRGDLAAAVDALLGNVFRYTPQGTAFEVEVSRRDGYVAVRVDDAGPGIADPKSALRRGSSDRGSTGLGLDIVRAAAVAGRGGVHIDRAALGGTSVVVLLADAQSPPPPRQLLGLVGRLSREPDERRWGRRARAARTAERDHTAGTTEPGTAESGTAESSDIAGRDGTEEAVRGLHGAARLVRRSSVSLRSSLSLVGRLFHRMRHR